jgi:hypothetical protein
MIVQGGPWVAMAVFCQNIEPQPDGTVDVRGIVDGVVVEPTAEDALGLHPAASVSLTALVSVKAGDVRGEHVLSLRSTFPSGSPGPGLRRPVEFTDAMPAASLVVPLELDIHEPGLYVFDAFCDEQLLTRMALWVEYATQSSA